MIAKSGNNIFLGALPKKLTKAKFFERFTRLPDFSPKKISKMKPEERLELLDDILLDYREPFNIHWHIYSKIHDCLRIGYKARPEELFLNRLELIEDWKLNKTKKDWQPTKTLIRYIPSCSLIGISGVGKSTAVDECLNLYPQIIFHKTRNKIQVLYLKVTCPAKGSTKGLCIEVFRELDRLIGTNYHSLYSKSHLTEDNLMAAMSNIVHNHALGLLIVDEIQHLKVAKGDGKDAMLNFLKAINEIVAVPVFYIGTSQALKVLSGNLQVGRRSKGIGRILWDRFEYDSDDWNEMMESLWEMQILPKRTKLTEQIRFTYYDETQGITDFLTTLHICVQKWVQEKKVKVITPELIKEVAYEELAGLQEMISALRSRDYEQIKRFPDISMEPALMQNFSLETNNKTTFELDQPDVKSLIEVFKKTNKNLVDKDLNKHASLIAQVFSDSTLKTQLKQLKKMITTLKKNKPKSQKKGKPTGLLIDLGKKAKKEGLDLSKLIEEAGLTLKLKEFIKF